MTTRQRWKQPEGHHQATDTGLQETLPTTVAALLTGATSLTLHQTISYGSPPPPPMQGGPIPTSSCPNVPPQPPDPRPPSSPRAVLQSPPGTPATLEYTEPPRALNPFPQDCRSNICGIFLHQPISQDPSVSKALAVSVRCQQVPF